jgi:hypothetical protein
MNYWYLDNGTLAGPRYKVLEDLISIQKATADIGLCLNPRKCELYVTGGKHQDTIDSYHISISRDSSPGRRRLHASGSASYRRGFAIRTKKKTDKFQTLG